jgi:ketosteroid isomerase-like protein
MFFDAARSGKASSAWLKFLSEDARIYRPWQSPVFGKTALRAWIERQGAALVRVWKRNEKGDWRIVFDVNNQLPDDQK